MTTLNDAYINALLADATYVDLINGRIDEGDNKDSLDERLTKKQADFLVANFELVTSINSGEYLGSGFDAVVWRGKSGTDYAGKIFVSMRGTEGLQDFLTDADLAVSGNARNQMVDMVNWWLKISTPVGQSAIQITLENIYDNSYPPVTIGTQYVAAQSVFGEGLITASDIAKGIEVNGHSLGGYLASAFTRLFGVQANVTHTSTFNSAGFAPGSEAVFVDANSIGGIVFDGKNWPILKEAA